jgi:hypothetical protein
MELAIPLVFLGGMYVISNQNKKPIENFSNGNGKSRSTNYLPNVDPLVQNYPVLNKKELLDNTSAYLNPNSATDKYFNQNLYQKQEQSGAKIGNDIQQIYSLTGNFVDSTNFEHNNMVPFFGGKIKGQVYNENMAETVLDNMVGTGSQMIRKTEQAPLFKPQDNTQWSRGAPNMSDFYQSRVNPGTMNSMVKPFESERVGPGLGKGYTTEGSNGFNSGMEDRNAWLPKTIDELRVATNPKVEYSLDSHEGPSYSYVQNRGIIGTVEKNNPDKFYIQTQDRWLTTTGQEKGEMLRPIQEVPVTDRSTLTKSYTGIASITSDNPGYAPKNYSQSKRIQLKTSDVAQSCAQGRGPHNDKDNALRSHTNYSTNRALLKQPDTMRSSFSGAIGAVVAPLFDIFRPTRKDETMNNVRIYGDAGSSVPDSYIINPNDITPTTIKETTIYSPNFYVGGQKEGGGYTVNAQQPIYNQRDTTNCNTFGIAGGDSSKSGDMIYSDVYKTQQNNDKKEPMIESRTNHGNTQIFNQHMHLSSGSKFDSDRNNNRMFVPTNMPSMPSNIEIYGKTNMSNHPQIHNMACERIQPDILNAFKSNPYTHSLTSAV